MEDQERLSQTSSSATVSLSLVREKEKVQTFGKRCQALKRDPNCAVLIRGWLHKKDSTGLKLWKRRWFVLSDFCLYYYKDSREECVLGSVPLPSYRILLCSPRECRNRKHAFKVVHQGMRPYILSADTQEDMLGWVRALGQSARMETDDVINRRCASFQDFTQWGSHAHMTERASQLTRVQTEPTLLELPEPRRLHQAFTSADLHPPSLQTPPSPSRCGTWTNDDPPYSLYYCSDYQAEKPDVVVRDEQPIRELEMDTDLVLTRLCGCDKLLRSVSAHLARLEEEKRNIQCVLEVRWLRLDRDTTHTNVLQEELVMLRTQICDASLEMDRLWSDYERMESELSVLHSHLQHILHFGAPQEQVLAQRQLWMMEDILSGLRGNQSRFMGTTGLHQHTDYSLQNACDFQDASQSFNKERACAVEAEPLLLTRVLTSTLPTTLTAERVFLTQQAPPPTLESGSYVASEKQTGSLREKFSSDCHPVRLSTATTEDSGGTGDIGDTARAHQDSKVVVIESHSVNHISTLTVFKDHQPRPAKPPTRSRRSSDEPKLPHQSNQQRQSKPTPSTITPADAPNQTRPPAHHHLHHQPEHCQQPSPTPESINHLKSISERADEEPRNTCEEEQHVRRMEKVKRPLLDYRPRITMMSTSL